MKDIKEQNNEKTTGQYTIKPELISAIMDAVKAGDKEKVKSILFDLHPSDIADTIESLDANEREKLTKSVGRNLDPESLMYLDSDVRDEVIGHLGPKRSAAVITKLETDDAVQVMEDLEKGNKAELLEAMPIEQRGELEEGLSHPEDSAGRLMDRKFVAVPEDWNVGQTIDYIRSAEDLPDDFYSVFILNKKLKPIGSVIVSKVLRSSREVTVKDIMDSDLKTININMDQEEVAHLFRKYALSSAPVLDESGIMIGRITIDDALEVLQEEAEEDIMHLGGVQSIDIHSASTTTAIRRFPWLFINLLTAIAASVIIAVFEDAIQKLVALAVLMPIVASMAGNAGTQTLTVAVRAIATKDLTMANAMRVLRKEINASIINGILFAAIVWLTSMALYNNFYLSFVFSISIMASLVAAAFAGIVIPIGLVKAGVDPAIASGVFLTTVTDMSAFFTFLGLASWLII